MTTFQYKGFGVDGRACAGLIEAIDPKEAREKLAGQGVLAERLHSASEGRQRLRLRRSRPFQLQDRAMFYRELSGLLKAGLPIAQALEILIETPELGESRPLVAAVRDRLREGVGLAAAMQDVSPRVTSFEAALLQAGERSGSLDGVVAEMAEFLEEQQRVNERGQTAFIYPAIIVGLAVVVAVVAMGYMIPAMAALLEEARVELPWVTRCLIGAGHLVSRAGVPLLLLAGVACWLVRRRLKSRQASRLAVDRWLLTAPIVRNVLIPLVSLRFAQTLATLLRGGVSVVEGVAMAGHATGNRWLASVVEQEAAGLRHGEAVSSVLRRLPVLGEGLPGWVRAGEASGNLNDMLESAAARYRQRWEQSLARLLAILEPALILLVAGFVLVVSLGILLPLLRINQTLQ